jgi:error-prone DNA polymerase
MPYAELHCHSAFSFLDGASHPVELAAAAAEQGHSALALTDHDGLHGAMELAQATKPLGVRTIVGAELTLDDGHHLTLLCESEGGYRDLCRLLTLAHRGTRPAPGREPLLPQTALEAVERHAGGLVCLSGCAREGALAARVERGEHRAAAELGRRLRDAFGRERFRVELQRPFARRDRRRNRLLAELAERLGVPAVATGNVHAHEPARAALQDAFVAVRQRATLDESEPLRRGNRSHVLAPPQAMAERFRDHPEAVHESGRLAERLRFDLTEDLGYRYPGADDETADRRLAELCRTRLEERYTGRPSRAEAAERLERELAVIRHLKLSGFFLLHRDMLELAREVACEVRGPETARALLPPGRGRGSSVSSIVCYLTGLSHVDPVEKDLFLGRFLNEELAALPDIDLDFPRDVREVLIPRVHERYGHDRSALVAAFATYRTRSAVRDLGKALGLPPVEVERLARAVDPWGSEGIERDIAACVGERRAVTPRWRALARLVHDAQGLPRHQSQHSGGMVISTESLAELCPIQPAAMEGRQMVQWDKESCADAGFLKLDLLGLGMLSAVERCVEEIARVRDERIDLSRIPLDDQEVYRQIQAAETTGTFQIESRAQMQMLRRTRPESLDDLTVQVALVRPGPIQGGAVHPYIERRKALRADPGYHVPYEHPSLEPVLRDTLGAIVFQDQVIEVAMAFAGFSPGEAEGLRRAMSKKRSEAAMRSYEQMFVDGAMARGVSRQVAERVYAQIVGFSGFGFPKAHSAAFGLLAYQSMWLRVHYPPEFLCALLNEQPMGFYPPDTLVHEAQRRGVEVLPPCVLRSGVECAVEKVVSGGWWPAGPVGCGPSPSRGRAFAATRRSGAALDGATANGASETGGNTQPKVEGDGRSITGNGGVPRSRFAEMMGQAVRDRLAVRIGLGYVAGVREEDVRELVAERERGGPFGSATELAARCPAHGDALERLAWAGGCDALVGEEGSFEARRRALWLLGVSPSAAATGPKSEDGTQLALPLEPAPAPALRAMTPWERMLADYGSTKVTLREHPLGLMRATLGDDVLSSAELARARDGARVRVAGLVVARQRPATGRGVTFMLLEDEHGTINLIVPPPAYERCRLAVRAEPLVLGEGKLEHREGVTNVVCDAVRRLERPDLPLGEVRHIEPRRVWSSEAGEEAGQAAAAGGSAATDDLRAVAPAAHSFGRRGR